MQSVNSLIIRVKPMLEGSLGGLMNAMRTWLDHQKIQPAGFKPAALEDGAVVFDVAFGSAADAALFQTAFAPLC